MYETDFALTVMGWAPFVSCMIAAVGAPQSWSIKLQVAHVAAWVTLGWMLVVAHAELAQFVASVNASTDQEILDLYSNDGASRAFASIFGWFLPLGGFITGLMFRALFNWLRRRHDRRNELTQALSRRKKSE